MFDRALFSAAIQSHLLHRGLSLREAAKESGVSASTLSRIINGEAPDLDSFASILTWLKANANQFFSTQYQENMLNEAWTGLYLCLQELGVPAHVRDAIVTIVQKVTEKEG